MSLIPLETVAEHVAAVQRAVMAARRQIGRREHERILAEVARGGFALFQMLVFTSVYCALPAVSFVNFPAHSRPQSLRAVGISRLSSALHAEWQPWSWPLQRVVYRSGRLLLFPHLSGTLSRFSSRADYYWRRNFEGVTTRRRADVLLVLKVTGSPSEGEERDIRTNMLEIFYEKAAQLLKDSGGQLDSLAFGRAWKKAFPDDDLGRYKDEDTITISQMLERSPRFSVEGRPGSSSKTFCLAASQAPASPSSVEKRQSERGYSFSVIKPQDRGSVTKTRPSFGTARQPGSRGGGGGGGGSAGGGEGGNGASKLMDIWSQAGALSDANDGAQQVRLLLLHSSSLHRHFLLFSSPW